MLWAVFTLIAAAAQTARNAMQRELTATLGTVGATHVRFLFGFPFALLFLAGALIVTGADLPHLPPVFWPWVFAGAFTQIAATATMLAVMGQRSFVVAYAYIKTEPVHVALFGLIFLGDKITPIAAVAILLATAGVIVISQRGQRAFNRHRPLFRGAVWTFCHWLSRRDIVVKSPRLHRRSDIHRDDRSGDSGDSPVGVSPDARPKGSPGYCARVAAVSFRRVHGSFRVGILVSRVCHHERRQRAYAGIGRSAVRTRRDALRVQAADHGA